MKQIFYPEMGGREKGKMFLLQLHETGYFTLQEKSSFLPSHLAQFPKSLVLREMEGGKEKEEQATINERHELSRVDKARESEK